MLKLLRGFCTDERGLALPIVLSLLAIGGLTVAVTLNYSTTNLNGSKITREKMEGIYSAAAGVEHVLWSLGRGEAPANTTPESINQMMVGMQTQNLGTFTLYFGQMVNVSSSHNTWLDVAGTITDVGGQYQYNITVTWQPENPKNIRLIEVGVRLPLGYTYVPGSAAGFPTNMSTGNPNVTVTDAFGAYMYKWTWNPGQGPLLKSTNPVKTQDFYITGSGALTGDYAWVIAQDQDIGTVGEVTGGRYLITAIARRPDDNKVTAKIVADTIVKSDGTITVASWKITK